MHLFVVSVPSVPSCLKPLFQSQAKCKAIDMKMIFYSHANKTHFHKKDCALSLVLKVKTFETRKQPIQICIPACEMSIECLSTFSQYSVTLGENCYELNSLACAFTAH